jgi:hypothetical protein
MSTWNIYHKDGSKLTDVNGEQITVHGLEYSDSWMGECFVTINFKHEVPINFQIGDYLFYRGERFELNYEPGKDKQARPDTYGEGFVYDSVKFNALQDELARAEFLDVVLNDNELHYTSLPKFPFFVQTLDDLLDRIQANLDEQIGAGLWKIYSRNKERSVQRGALESEWLSVYGEKTDDNVIESMSITVDSKKCWDALALVNEKWDVNFIVRGRNIYVGTTGIEAGHIFSYGLGKGLYEIVQNADSDQSVITRLRAYGSEKNLPSHYYADLGVKYVANITKVVTASTNVELELDLDYIETYFKNKRKYVVSGESQEQSNGWVLQVTFDFQTTITGYVTQSGSSGKCRFYSELKGGQVDSGDEESKEKLDAFISQVKAGNTKMYITSGLNKKAVPSSMKEYAKNLPNNMSINRLMLPGFPHVSLSDFYDSLTEQEKKYVNPTGKLHRFSTDPYRPYIDSLNIEEIGLRSASQFFDTDDKTNGVIEIYPTIEEMEIGGVRVDEIDEGVAPNDDGRFGDNETVKNVDIYLNKAIDFDINDLKDDDFSISMKDGMCGGRTFKVASSTKVDGRWRLTIERSKDDALELWFPYKDYPIKNGDHFVLTGITLPDSYVNAASLKLLKYAIALLDKNDYTRYVYQPKVDELFMVRQHDLAQADETGTIKSLHDTLKAGDLMNFNDTDLNIEGIISIDQLTIKEEDGKIPTYDITLREDKEVGTIQKIQQQISSLQSGNGGTGAGLTTTQVKNQVATEGSKHFISKINDDTAKGTITWEKIQKFLGGLQSGEFESGLYGHGAQVDKRGDAEFNSIFAREFIRAPKFVFNEIEVTKAEHWNTNGYGTIKTVDTQKHIISLKLEENDYGSLMVGDICRGIYADLGDTYKSSQNNDGTLDENNFIVRKGFFTSYFYVKKVVTAQKGEFIFEYGKKSDAYPDPCPFMDFAQYGNFNNTQRQSSMYFSSRGRSYIEVLEGVNSWEIQAEHRVCRYGDLTGLFIRKDDGTMTNLKGNGLFAQNHVYLGGAVITLSNISDLDDLVLKLSTYDVTLSAYSSVITVDDMGNVIDGLWTQDSEGGNKQYRISTAVFVSQAGKPLLLEDESSKYCTEGHYRVYATGDGCDVSVANGTVFVTGIDNIKDGVAGSGDDSSFDYDTMRKMTDCKVTIVVELEGKGTRTLDFPIRIHHDSLPFMVCDLTNEHAAVSWHTKHTHYAGLPLQTEVNMMYKNTPYSISELSVSLPSSVSKYLKATVTDKAKAKVVTIDKVSDFASDVLPTSFDITITAVAIYAGARYEYTKVLTISKTSDYVVYELVPSVNSVTVDSADRVSPGSVSCDVWATSSDDKRYKVTLLPSGFGLYYSKNDNALSSISLGGSVSVSASDNKVSFVLKHTEGGVEYIDDKEDIPVVSDGKESAVVYSSDNIVSIPVDVNGKVLSALNASVSFRIFAGDKELTVNSVAISSLPSNRAVSANVSNNVLVLKCGAGTSFGKEEVSYTLSVQGANGNVTHTGYTTVKVLPNVMGKSVKDVNTYYALNDSATSKPADSSFTYDAISSAVISSNASKYLWSGDKITYDDNTTAITGVYMVGRCSELATVTEQYAKTTTNSAPSSGWSETYPSVGKGVYVWSRDKITWKNGSVTYSSAQLVAYIGNDGKDGNDSTVPGPKGDSITITSTSVTYQIHNSGTTPPTGTWSPSIPSVTDEKPYLWTKTYVLYSDGTSTTSFSVATKGKQGASVTGRTGSVVRASIWNTGVAFYCGDTLVNGQYYVDVVYVADDTESDGWAKYQCIKNHTSSSSITTSNGTYWKRMSSASIYAPLIVGKNASIDFAQGQQFNLMEGYSVWGSFRYVNTGDSPALWLGGTDSRYAPFSVTKNGYIKATSGQIGSFRITEFTDSVSKLKFYDLYAEHDSFGVIEASQLNLGAQGITVGVGNVSLGAYGRISMGHAGAGNKETGFTYNNILSVNVVCHNGDETGATYISAEGSVEKVKALTVYAAQGTHNYAVYSDAGMIRGALCPRVKVISSDYSLKENDNVIICTNSGAIDIQFPSNPAVGQSYIIIQVDGDLYFKGGASFRGRLNDANRNSKTKGQINFFFFDGTHWSNSYAN